MTGLRIRPALGRVNLNHGNCLDRFRLIRRIKPAGGVSDDEVRLRADTVWHAFDADNRREVALKCTGRPPHPIIRDLLLREDASSHSIVQLHGLIVSDGLWVEVTPWFADGTLADRFVRMGRAGQAERIAEAERLLDCMRSALDWLHGETSQNQAIVHNDIKPGNIFIDGESFRLGDFGNAAVRPSGRSGSNPIPASARYAPPERFASGYSESGDCWALGLVLAELLLGHHPFFTPSANGQLVEIADSANLANDWQITSPAFHALPDAWRGLLFGLTALDQSKRWRLSQIKEWSSGDAQRRTEAVIAGLQLGGERGFHAENPYLIGGTNVTTAQSASEVLLRTRDASDVVDPSALADWVENECNSPQAAGAVRQSLEIGDLDLRQVRIALSLDRNCQLAWRTTSISRNLIRDYASGDDERQLDWVASLRGSGVLDVYAAKGNMQAAEISRDLRATELRLNSAFQDLRDNGCNIALPDVAAQWRMACQIAFVPEFREFYRARVSHLSDATGLFARPAWITRLGGSFDQLGVEQLLALDWAERQNGLGAALPLPTASDEIPYRDGTDEELHAAPLIWLKTQESLLGRMKVADILEPMRLRGGDYYPQSAGQLPNQRLRRWLRQIAYPWIARRFRNDPAARLSRLGAVGDHFNVAPALDLSATLYQTKVKLDGNIAGPDTYACEVRWSAPEGYDVQLQLRRPGLFRDAVIWKTPRHGWLMRTLTGFFTQTENRQVQPSGLSRIGSMALSLCQNTVLTLEARPRLPMLRLPTYRSGEIAVVLPEPNLKFVTPQQIVRERFDLHKIDSKITQPEIKQMRISACPVPISAKIGDGMNLSRRLADAERRMARLCRASNYRGFKFNRQQRETLEQFFESRHHQQGETRP